MNLRTKLNGLEEIRRSAEVFRWASDLRNGTMMLWRGAVAIEIDVSDCGSVLQARRYDFFSLNDLRLRQHAPDKHTKETVLSWLAE